MTSGLGMKTERDRVSIHWTAAEIESAVEDFRRLDEVALRKKYSLGSDSRDWKVSSAKSDVLSNTEKGLFRPVLYRPFDIRHTWYSGKTRGFIGTPGYRTMRHMNTGDNLGLVASRTVYGATPWRDVLATKYMVEFGVMATRPGNSAPVFPLYLYPEDDNLLQLEKRRPNLTQEFIQAFSEKLGFEFVPHDSSNLEASFGPKDIFNYAYAVFFSPTYRERYAEFLKIDFPRLPLTSDRTQFSALAEQGAKLVELHLMNSPALNRLTTSFPATGNNEVREVRYVEPKEQQEGHLFINEKQYFDGIEPEVWHFHIGGYQVLHKWLKDRKGRTLSFEDIMHYQRIVVALSETRRIMQEIDELIPAWPIE